MNEITKLIIMLCLAASLAGCPTGRTPVKPINGEDGLKKPTDLILMEPLHLGLQADAELGLTDFDAATLFHEGLRLHEAEDFERALKFYDRILSEFPESRYVSSAAFNAGRCLDILGRSAEAIARYLRIADGMPKSKDWVDAMFRLAEAYTGLDRQAAAIESLKRLLAKPDLNASDRVDASVLLGEAHKASGELLRAEHTLRRALKLFRTHEKEEYLDPAPAARAEFRLAELATGRYEAAPLRLPEDRMRDDLEAKARMLLSAQSGYLRTMRWGNPEWATASGYRIGKLYLDLHKAMEGSAVPEDFSAEEVEVYRDVLRKRLVVLLRKALKVFAMTLQLAERTRSDNAWTRAARQEMERVEALVLSLQEPMPGPASPEPPEPEAVPPSPGT
jgi:tetratricopeptide (TPR) repeat protein